MSKGCSWQTKGPTLGEMFKRGELIQRAIAQTLGPEFARDLVMSIDRATCVVRGMDFTGEYDLMLPEEKAEGHWVHARPHSENCEAS